MRNEHHITNLHIENFKSIKNMVLKCKRINIIVGKPNVGKSNVLEALSTLSFSKIDSLVRYNQFSNLFYDNAVSHPIRIKCDALIVIIYYTKKGLRVLRSEDIDNILLSERNFRKTIQSFEKLLDTIKSSPNGSDIDNEEKVRAAGLSTIKGFDFDAYGIDGEFNTLEYEYGGMLSVFRYIFKPNIEYTNNSELELDSPFGNNLVSILSSNHELRKEVASYFKEYGLELVIDAQTRELEIQKRLDGLAFKYSYNLIADTLQRVIFHLAAIKSNDYSILLFEEPEAHSFPPYIARIANEIVASESNQFFIATHSPYLLNTIIENTSYADRAIFIASYKNYQTELRELTEEEISEMLNFGTDVFINYSAFVD